MNERFDPARWEPLFERWIGETAGGDAAHDIGHIRRVVANARALADEESADLAIVLPAAWLHDCVIVPKDSPQRSRASILAAEAACAFLAESGYPPALLPAISHAIQAHSFSAAIPPRSAEARVVQDADRLDAIGAIGVARCLMLGGALGRRLYDPDEPFPRQRTADDLTNTIDHFYVKLLRIAEQMTTVAGRAEAERRTGFMRAFLAELGREIGDTAAKP